MVTWSESSLSQICNRINLVNEEVLASIERLELQKVPIAQTYKRLLARDQHSLLNNDGIASKTICSG